MNFLKKRIKIVKKNLGYLKAYLEKLTRFYHFFIPPFIFVICFFSFYWLCPFLVYQYSFKCDSHLFFFQHWRSSVKQYRDLRQQTLPWLLIAVSHGVPKELSLILLDNFVHKFVMSKLTNLVLSWKNNSLRKAFISEFFIIRSESVLQSGVFNWFEVIFHLFNFNLILYALIDLQ